MTRASHGACGKTWEQAGNKSGHCSGCHETFYGLTAFDAHRKHGVCLPQPYPGAWWVDDDGQHHRGERMTAEQIAERWG